MEIEPDSEPAPVASDPSLAEVEERLRSLCREAELREPDRVVEFVDGDYVALWDEEKVAVVVEMDGAGR